MSLRPEIFGFRLEKMQSMFGCANRDLLQEIADRSSEPLDFDVPGETEAILEQAVMKGVPFENLVAENDHHVTIACILAAHGQSLVPVDSNDWKADAFRDFMKDEEAKMDGRSRDLLSYFLNGRPLFGKKSAATWSYYGFLKQGEVQELRAGLTALRKSHAEFQNPNYLDGFLDHFEEWLGKISDNRLDLWFFFV